MMETGRSSAAAKHSSPSSPSSSSNPPKRKELANTNEATRILPDPMVAPDRPIELAELLALVEDSPSRMRWSNALQRASWLQVPSCTRCCCMRVFSRGQYEG